MRHLPESNPWSYAERMLMVKAAAQDLGLDLARVHPIPFPVNEPELWAAYVPAGVTQYIRLFSDWGGTKLDRLREAGYEVVVLDEGSEKEVSGVEVRSAVARRRRVGGPGAAGRGARDQVVGSGLGLTQSSQATI